MNKFYGLQDSFMALYYGSDLSKTILKKFSYGLKYVFTKHELKHYIYNELVTFSCNKNYCGKMYDLLDFIDGYDGLENNIETDSIRGINPFLLSHAICGVQSMRSPSGIVFKMRNV